VASTIPRLASAIPVLQVADISLTIAWYSEVLGFSGWAFPTSPPHVFALLNRDGVELMLQRSRSTSTSSATVSNRTAWAVYIRVTGGQLLALAATIKVRSPLLRGPERMPYGDVEFAVSDPDGHVIVLSEQLSSDADVPAVGEDDPST
jgi:uncharacterized glyoxalase superfamily protein PhnB